MGSRRIIVAGAGGVIAQADKLLAYGAVSGLNAELIPRLVPGGRLSASAVLPVTVADVSAAAALKYLPYNNDIMPQWNGSNWRLRTIPEAGLNLNVSGLDGSSMYAVYSHLVGDTPTLEAEKWTNILTRATGLTRTGINGMLAKTGALDRLHLADIYIDSGGGAVSDGVTSRGIANRYNRVVRELFTCPGYNDNNSTTTWTTTSTTFAKANGGTGSTLALVSLGEDPVQSSAHGATTHSGNTGRKIGVGVDGVTNVRAEDVAEAQSGLRRIQVVRHPVLFAEGYHTLDLVVQTTSGTATFHADGARTGNTADARRTYIAAEMLG